MNDLHDYRRQKTIRTYHADLSTQILIDHSTYYLHLYLHCQWLYYVDMQL